MEVCHSQYGIFLKLNMFFIQLCTGRKVQRALGQSDVIYTCESVCEVKTEYSLQRGKLTVSEIMASDLLVVFPNLTFYEQKLGPLEEIYIPSCLPCPLCTKCESTIEALPNYWGYEIQINLYLY